MTALWVFHESNKENKFLVKNFSNQEKYQIETNLPVLSLYLKRFALVSNEINSKLLSISYTIKNTSECLGLQGFFSEKNLIFSIITNDKFSQ